MDELIEAFIDRYLSRREIMHRLPVSVPIGQFWQELQKARRDRATLLPLKAQSGEPFWFVLNSSIEKQCDSIAALARRDIAFSGAAFDRLFEDAVIDEAVYSSMIEGAFTTREAAIGFIREQKSPANKSEQMVKSNYDALSYVLENLESPITEKTIISVAQIVTRNAADSQVSGYRTEGVIVGNSEGVVYTPPSAERVPEMMRALIEFISKSELHPILKACIAHFYFVYIHPFADGNGRTARALSYMMLLQAGYDFFRYFSISGLVAKERGKYYRAMLCVEESDCDMTYFIDCYSELLSRTVAEMERHLMHHVLAEEKLKALDSALSERQIKGAKWLLKGEKDSVTVEVWKKKFKVVTETARRDLLTLCEQGLLVREMDGRKAVFLVERQVKNAAPKTQMDCEGLYEKDR